MRVLIFGDSITQGFWGVEGGWVERLRKQFHAKLVTDLDNRDDPDIFNLGISGDNSRDIANRYSSETTSRTWNKKPITIVQVGVNDSSFNPGPVDVIVALPIEDYRANLIKIINESKIVSSKLIFIGLSACDELKTTPTAWGDYHYTNAAIQKYEQTMQEVAAEHDIAFIPLFEVFKQALDDGADFLPDGLHPNDTGHAFIAEHLRKKLTALLK